MRIAHELLADVKQVRDCMTRGMTLLYTGERRTVADRDCYIFALGANLSCFYYGAENLHNVK